MRGFEKFPEFNNNLAVETALPVEMAAGNV